MKVRTAILAFWWIGGLAPVALGADLAVTFDDAAMGRVPEGWRVANTNGGREPATWVVGDVGGRKAFSLVEPERALPGDLYNVALMPDVQARDVDVSVQVRANAGRVDQGGGLLWRAQDARNYYVAHYNPLERNLRVYYVKDGARRQLATAERLEVGSGAWFTLRVVHRGDSIEAYLNGEKRIEVRDGTFRNAGAVGLWTKADAATSFDDLFVKDL